MRKTLFKITLIFLLYAHIGCAQSAASDDQITRVQPYRMAKYDREISKLLAANTRTHHRIQTISASFLSQPYYLDALGEGVNGRYDQHPLYRTDAFDCTTYVSTVLAMVVSNDLASFKKAMRRIQYRDGVVDFKTRNHFISADWNVQNVRQGYIKEVTTQLKLPYRSSNILIDKPGWYHAMKAARLQLLHPPRGSAELLASLHAIGDDMQAVSNQLFYIPVTSFFHALYQEIRLDEAALDRLPSNAIIEIVYEGRETKRWIGTNIHVFHMGFIFKDKRGWVFRHASAEQGKVVDEPLPEYLEGLYRSYSDPRRVGLAVFEIVPPAKSVV